MLRVADPQSANPSARIEIFERSPSGQYLLRETLAGLPGLDAIGPGGLDMAYHGDRLQLVGEGTTAVLALARSSVGQWSESWLPVSGIEFGAGDTLDHDGDHLVVATISALNAPILDIFELDSTGAPGASQSFVVPSRAIKSPQSPHSVAIDGSRLLYRSVADPQGLSYIYESASTGWNLSATIPEIFPTLAAPVASLDVEGDVVAIARDLGTALNTHVVLVHGPSVNPTGQWPGLHIIDLPDPMGAYPPHVESVRVHGGRIYVSMVDSGATHVFAPDPSDPLQGYQRVSTIDRLGGPVALGGRGSGTLVGRVENGLKALDLSSLPRRGPACAECGPTVCGNPDDPRLTLRGASLGGTLRFVTPQVAGVRPTSAVLLAASPMANGSLPAIGVPTGLCFGLSMRSSLTRMPVPSSLATTETTLDASALPGLTAPLTVAWSGETWVFQALVFDRGTRRASTASTATFLY